MVSIKETVNGCFYTPNCQELPENWEDSFFRQLNQGYVDVANNNNDDGNLDDEVQELPSRSWLPIETQYFALKMSCIFLNPRGMLTRQILCLK